jgi:hypothetical protein
MSATSERKASDVGSPVEVKVCTSSRSAALAEP